MTVSPNRWSPTRVVVVTVVASAGLLLLVGETTRPVVAFVGQFCAWGLAVLIVRRRTGELRISDPGVLVLGWAALYMLYPSVAWIRGEPIPFAKGVPDEHIGYLLCAHAVYLLAFSSGYSLFGRRRKSTHGGPFNTRGLPNGKALFILPALLLFLLAIQRLVTTGSLLSSASYGDQWFALQGTIGEARQAGGLSYFLAQVQGKAFFYPLLVQGIGTALVLLHKSARSFGMAPRIAVGGWFVLSLIMGNSTRSSLLLVIIVAAVIWDRIAGPIRTTSIAGAVLIGLVLFVFMGYFRQETNANLSDRIGSAIGAYNDEGAPLYEFSVMLGKEASVLALPEEYMNLGPDYFIRAPLGALPSQIVPTKTDTMSTADLLSLRLLGPAAFARGNGIAGTMIGDGVRVGGLWGVGALALVVGALFAGVKRWEERSFQPDGSPQLVRLMLAAGICAWSFAAIRGDLSTLIVAVVYYLLLPYGLLVLLTDRRSSIFRPLSSLPAYGRVLNRSITT